MSARFPLYTGAELAAMPAPGWLIDGVLPAGGLSVLVGEKSSFKSFLALDWAIHVHLGMEWHGHRVQGGQVLYIYAEGRFGIGPRLAAWQSLNGYHEPLDVLFLPQRVAINEPGDTGDLLAAIEARCASMTLAAIVIDTLNRNSTGNENSSEDMTAYVTGCDRLRQATGAHVLSVHHKGHGESDRGRGSSVLDAAADTVIFASRDASRLTLKCQKQKDAAEFPPILLEALPLAQSLALRPSGVNCGALDGKRLDYLRALHEHSTDAGIGYTTWMRATGAKSGAAFDDARKWLLDMGYARCDLRKYAVSDAGRLALAAVVTPLTPPALQALHGAMPSHSTPEPRVFIHGGDGVGGPEGEA